MYRNISIRLHADQDIVYFVCLFPVFFQYEINVPRRLYDTFARDLMNIVFRPGQNQDVHWDKDHSKTDVLKKVSRCEMSEPTALQSCTVKRVSVLRPLHWFTFKNERVLDVVYDLHNVSVY